MILKTEGIVLKSFDFRETSRIAAFFTRDYGKLKGVLKGIRKDPKKFGSSIDRFSVNDIVYYPSRHSDLHLVSHCDLKEYFFPIRQDYKRSLAANYLLELVDTLLPVEETNRNIYQLMTDYLRSLQTVLDIDKLVRILQIKILFCSGFRPHLDCCVKCQKKIKGRVRFSTALGGLVCPDCPAAETNFSVISEGAIATVLHIERDSWEKSLRIGMTALTKRELKFILNNFLIYHLEKRLKSERFLSSG